MFQTIATYNGVGTEYRLELSDDSTMLRLVVESGPTSRVIKEERVARETFIEQQRAMAMLMVEYAIDEVRLETATW